MTEAKDQTKDNILKSAIALMNQYGYGAMSLSELARASQITKQRLYYHFKDSEEILLILAKQWGQTGQEFTIRTLAETHEVGPYKILAMNKAVFDWMKHDFELSKLGLVIFQSAPHLKSLSDVITKIRSTGRERIHTLLLQDPKFKKMSNKKIEDIVTAIHSQLYGFYFYIVTMNDYKNLDIHEKNCNEALRKIIDSYLI